MMHRIQLPLWIRHGECLLTALCAIGIGAATLLFPQTPWGQKTPLQTATSQKAEQSVWRTQTIQWPLFLWQPITPNQLQQRVLGWLFAPKRHWQSQHSKPTSNTKQPGPSSYSATLHLSADELDTLWQSPLPMPAWPGWALTEASGIYHGDHWKIKLHWHTVSHQKTATAQTNPDFWHGANLLAHTGFAYSYWQPPSTQATPSKVNNAQNTQPIASPAASISASTPPAYLVGLLQSASVTGAWLQVPTNQHFFLAEAKPWQGFVLDISPQNIVYLSKGTQRWQLNKCQHTNPCLVKRL